MPEVEMAYMLGHAAREWAQLECAFASIANPLITDACADSSAFEMFS